jgi:hypothetical protein
MENDMAESTPQVTSGLREAVMADIATCLWFDLAATKAAADGVDA